MFAKVKSALVFSVFGLLLSCSCGLANSSAHTSQQSDTEIAVMPLPLTAYVHAEAEKADALGVDTLPLSQVLKMRIAKDPFNLVATIIFFCAIFHTFLAGKFLKLAHRFEHSHQHKMRNREHQFVENKEPVSFKATLLHFLGEVEVVFGIWLIPLGIAAIFFHGWEATEHYFDTRNYVEPVFVVVIMAIASTRPVIKFAESALKRVASIGKCSPAAWWLSILTFAPILGSFITEPAAMTIGALLLGQQVYTLKPPMRFAYATLGLLFVNVSVGGTLTHFAAPPVLMVAGTFHYDLFFVLGHFGWRAVLGILCANTLYFFMFRNTFAQLKKDAEAMRQAGEGPLAVASPEAPVPFWVALVHLCFAAWTVFTLHHPPLFIGGFLFFLAFIRATDHHQYEISLKGPILVGFFLAGLVTHGGLQSWWIAPILSSLREVPLFIGATLLTAFNDNAAITFLASQVPAFLPEGRVGLELMVAQKLEFAVVAGAVTGGGLTVIANAPNPAGQSILSKYFPEGVSPLRLFLGSLLPTCIMACVFMVIP